MANFSHIDKKGNAVMVDVSKKNITERTAIAEGSIFMSEECFNLVKEHMHKKGDVLTIAQVAGIMGAKKTCDLIPLTHNINLENVEIYFEDLSFGFKAIATVKCSGLTGVEMEALTSISIALLTIYDMCKAIDKRMVIKDIHLVKKIGGKSGEFNF